MIERFAKAERKALCSSKLRAWLVENGLQLLEVNGFDQVKIESGFFRTLHVLLGAEAGEGDCLDVPFRPRLCGHFVTTSIGQTDVTQHRVDVVRGHDGHRAFHIICSYNVVTKMGKQTRQCAPGILVIFHEQYTQRFGCLAAERDCSGQSLRLPVVECPA